LFGKKVEVEFEFYMDDNRLYCHTFKTDKYISPEGISVLKSVIEKTMQDIKSL